MAKRIQKSYGGGDFHVTIDSLNLTDDVIKDCHSLLKVRGVYLPCY